MRIRMEGRLLVVQLLCRDVAAAGLGSSNAASVGGVVIPSSLLGVFTPCVAFRIAGSPARHISNVSEVLFAPNARSSDEATTAGLSTMEYIAIGVSSVLLGLIYVASVFLYLHIKKRRSKSEGQPENPVTTVVNSRRESSRKRELEKKERERCLSNIVNSEDGIVKKNPLLDIGRHFTEIERIKDEFLIESDESHNEHSDPNEENVDENPNDSHQITSVTVHPMIHDDHGRKIYESYYKSECFPPREENTIERLPEENVSIVETFDFRDDKTESMPIGSTRRKLYFNPAYFEPHLLLAPPPAAIEFLIKIREVIAIAKHKMATKRFSPSLGGIPEEDVYQSQKSLDFYHKGSQRSSVVSLKRENIRRKSYCTGCPGCETREVQDISPFSPEISTGIVCHNCFSTNGINKQVSIRKWLEGVPAMKSSQLFYDPKESCIPPGSPRSNANGLLHSLLSLPRDNSQNIKKHSNFTTRSLYAEDTPNNKPFKKSSASESARSDPSFRTFNIPLPSFKHIPDVHREPDINTVSKIKDITSIGIKIPDHKNKPFSNIRSPKLSKNHKMPDMINEALAIDKSSSDNTLKGNKKIHSIEIGKVRIGNTDSLESNSLNSTLDKKNSTVDYETDSLERGNLNRGHSTPTDYADVSSSQASPSLSAALPMDEEMTMRNAVYKERTESRPSSRISNKNNDESSIKSSNIYEPVEQINDFKKPQNAFDNHIYNIPNNPIIQRTDYSLVSEVYVNNGYNFESAPTTPSESDYSTFGKRKAVIRYTEPNEKPGQLTIEVKDSPENYIKIHESDDFEPDTLDRKPSKIKISTTPNNVIEKCLITDSDMNKNILDMKTSGIFKTSSLSFNNQIGDAFQSKRSFGSLKNIYESKKYGGIRPSINDIQFQTPKETVDSQDYEIIENTDVLVDSDEGRLLTLESRHCKRQRQSTPPNLKTSSKHIPPDVIPFEEANIYEYPKPPRLVEKLPPPLPPKNENGRSPSSRKTKYNSAVAVERMNQRSPSPPFLLSSGLCSPSGASVKSAHSSDYENIMQDDDEDTQIHVNPSIVKVNNQMDENRDDSRIDINSPAADCKSIQVPLKTTPKSVFREFQTPKAGRKIKNLPRKQTRDRPGSMKKPWRRGTTPQYKEDSGYLSTDSNESRRIARKALKESKISGSDTDESIEDARSESGAESVETHSVFFGSFRKLALVSNSVDSGRSSDDRSACMVSPIFTKSKFVNNTDDTNTVNVNFSPRNIPVRANNNS